LQPFKRANTVVGGMLSLFQRLSTAMQPIVLALALSTITSCGGPSRDIIGKWTTADANAIIWEFSPNGSVLVGKDKGRYSFGDQKRVKIQTSFATSVYQMQISHDHMTLTAPSGLKLELTRIK
jgi:hypothetical protein